MLPVERYCYIGWNSLSMWNRIKHSGIVITINLHPCTHTHTHRHAYTHTLRQNAAVAAAVVAASHTIQIVTNTFLTIACSTQNSKASKLKSSIKCDLHQSSMEWLHCVIEFNRIELLTSTILFNRFRWKRSNKKRNGFKFCFSFIRNSLLSNLLKCVHWIELDIFFKTKIKFNHQMCIIALFWLLFIVYYVIIGMVDIHWMRKIYCNEVCTSLYGNYSFRKITRIHCWIVNESVWFFDCS